MTASKVSKVEEDIASTQKADSKDLYNIKIANEAMCQPWLQQNVPYYNPALLDRQIPTTSYNNKIACPPFMQMPGNYQKYPPAYFNPNMFPIPQQLSYRNYGDKNIVSHSLPNHALPGNPYLPFSSFPVPPFLTPVRFPNSPKTTKISPKQDTLKIGNNIVVPPSSGTKTTLEPFSIFTSRWPRAEVNGNIIRGLMPDNGQQCEEKE